MDSKKNGDGKDRHISRLKREMQASRVVKNPFGSPPSSSGSHGTVSVTTTQELDFSDSSLGPPDAESTNRFDVEYPAPPAEQTAPRRTQSSISGRFAPKANYNFNTSALQARFPEWSTTSNLKEVQQHVFDPVQQEIKENLSPIVEDATTNSTNSSLGSFSKPSRAGMQASVRNESECSTVLSQVPPFRAVVKPLSERFPRFQPPSRSVSPEDEVIPSLQSMVTKIRSTQSTVRDRFGKTTKTTSTERLSPQTGKTHTRHPSPQASKANAKASSPQPRSVPAQSPARPVQPSPAGKAAAATASEAEGSRAMQTARSFFAPSFNHIPDWTSGTLKFSIVKNGTPVFVKYGKARTQNPKLDGHCADIDVLELAEDEQEIFVSMDKLRDEVIILQSHDNMLQKEAEKLQEENMQLQAELHGAKMRRSIDSAIGSGSESDSSAKHRWNAEKKKLEDQLTEAQAQADKAQRQLSVQDIHNNALIAERDEALQQSRAAQNKSKRLEAELAASQQDIRSSTRYRQEYETLQQEHESLQVEYQTLRREQNLQNQEYQELQADYQARGTEIEARRIANKASQQNIATLRDQLARLQAVHAACHRDEKLEAKLEHYHQTNQRLHAEAAEMRAQLESYNAQMMKMRTQCDAQSKEATEMRAHLEAQSDQMSRMRTQQDVQSKQAELHTRSQEDELHERHQAIEADVQETEEIQSQDEQHTEENMTSAFFVPDITLEKDATKTRQEPSLSKTARKVLNNLCEHSQRNCSVCARVRSASKTQRSSSRTTVPEPVRKTVKVRRPVPVSDRVPEPRDEYEEEPTMRPAQHPGQALAVIIKGLKDELEHLQQELAAKQQVYKQKDMSQGYRERKRLVGDIKRLMELCELKSDQIYTAYDVLEGQKQAGQEMAQEEMERTIFSIMGP